VTQLGDPYDPTRDPTRLRVGFDTREPNPTQPVPKRKGGDHPVSNILRGTPHIVSDIIPDGKQVWTPPCHDLSLSRSLSNRLRANRFTNSVHTGSGPFKFRGSRRTNFITEPRIQHQTMWHGTIPTAL